jgi:hypothetical protein
MCSRSTVQPHVISDDRRDVRLVVAVTVVAVRRPRQRSVASDRPGRKRPTMPERAVTKAAPRRMPASVAPAATENNSGDGKGDYRYAASRQRRGQRGGSYATPIRWNPDLIVAATARCPSSPTDQPVADQPGRRLPDHHVSPRELPPVGGLLVDATTRARLYHEPGLAVAAYRVRRHRPPPPSPGGPQPERLVLRALNPEAVTQRLHWEHHYRPGRARELSASNRNRAIAPPHTSSTYARSTSIP